MTHHLLNLSMTEWNCLFMKLQDLLKRQEFVSYCLFPDCTCTGTGMWHRDIGKAKLVQIQRWLLGDLVDFYVFSHISIPTGLVPFVWARHREKNNLSGVSGHLVRSNKSKRIYFIL